MSDQVMYVRSADGTTVNVRLVQEGDKYGPGRAMTLAGDGDLIEFYDARYQAMPGMDMLGKFLARYYVSNFLDAQFAANGGPFGENGFDLHTEEQDYAMDPDATAEIIKWVKQFDYVPLGHAFH